ncbi:MAG: hypothetical protein KIT10_06700 [Flavobacteriales bacterium]|nr:hypothetical protein [Flavobacteriales bacterium]
MCKLQHYLLLALALPGTGACAQDAEPMGIWRQRPRIHLSYGEERTGVQHYAFDARQQEWWSVMRPSLMVRVKGDWVVGASVAFYYERPGGSVFHVDSVVHYPASGSWPVFVPAYDLAHGDHVIIFRPEVDTWQLFAGYTLPRRWPRRRVHLAGTGTLGIQALRLRETHHYRFNFPPRYMQEPDDIHTAKGLGWALTASLRADLHITKFFSWYGELCMVQQLAQLDGMGSEGHWNGEVRSVPARRSDFSLAYATGGIALHL